ncbi:MAG: hypothetical protein RMX96_04655 [Nostoc sp. ChiSLP02]|nr:hypothetical protein [Nostoc sp. DedSLP05]MDZ8102850.1 hypothetical protein [Nostoc sp. DedSLP01]MDZ8184139.1 hypothetical protein [Nostoc sp. ChiSLP02]
MNCLRNRFLKIALTAVLSLGLYLLAANFNHRANLVKANSQPQVMAQANRPSWLAPSPPKFPHFRDRKVVIAKAQEISDNLEAHVKAWFADKAPAQIPSKLIPKGVDTKQFRNFRVVKPENITPKQQWAIRPAEKINLKATRGFFPDPNATYLVIPNLLAPFGSKVIIEGEFPYARFFDIQITPSFHPEAYRYGGFGVGEVPIVDVDINPLPGNVNPFRVGADRNAAKRKYRVTFDLAIGNPVDLNRAFRPPYYRAPGNNRVGGAIMYQGPWGETKPWGHGLGVWDMGQIWIRYYAIDKNKDSLGGVPLPKIYYQLPDGRKYYIQSDFERWTKRVNRRIAAKSTLPAEPTQYKDAKTGWFKKFGIFRAIVTGMAQEVPWLKLDQKYVRDLDLGVTGRGEDMPPPGNYSVGATECNYINYLVRGMSLGWGKVAVLTGKLPTTPRTRKGEDTIKKAQARYWSITATDTALPEPDGFVGAALHSVMDDEIITDNQRRYAIVLSRPEDRPKNATASNGVTWVNWGPTANVTWTLRWISVYPDWDFALTPDDRRMGWASDWASKRYDRSLIGNNSHDGALGEYLPRVHYMSKADFEKLGNSVKPDKIPIWQDKG